MTDDEIVALHSFCETLMCHSAGAVVAEEARQMTARSLKQEDKAFWLRQAEDWIKLAQQADENTKRQR